MSKNEFGVSSDSRSEKDILSPNAPIGSTDNSQDSKPKSFGNIGNMIKEHLFKLLGAHQKDSNTHKNSD